MSFIKYNNVILNSTNGSFVQYGSIVPPTPTITAGWTTITTGASRPSFDMAGGISKTIWMKTTQLEGGDFVSSYNTTSAFRSDQMPWYASGAGKWNHEWTNYNDYSAYTDMNVNFSYENLQNTVGIETIDFFNRTTLQNGTNGIFSNVNFKNYIHTIPSSTTSFFNYDRLSGVNYMFRGCAITGNIKPFIDSLLTLKPNISHTHCFSGCFSAADYTSCHAEYPDWF